jgi:hypothetical protein
VASGRELRINSGESQIINLAKARLKNAIRTFTNSFSSDLYSAGSLTNQINGLQAIVADTNTNTVGGIDAIRDAIPGMEAVFGLAQIPRNEERNGWFDRVLTEQQRAGISNVFAQAAQFAQSNQAQVQTPATPANPYAGLSAAIAAAAERARREAAASGGVAALNQFRG